MLENLKNLIANGKLKEAYFLAVELNRQNPNNKELAGLLQELTTSLTAQNENNLDLQISKVETLKQQGNFAEALKLTLNLISFAPSDKRLNSMLNDLKEIIESQHSKNIEQAKLEAKQLVASGKLTEALQIIDSNGLQADPIRISLVNSYIEQKLESNSAQIKILPPIQVLKFLQNLQSLNNQHPKVNELIKEQVAREKKHRLIQIKESIRQLKFQIKVLYHQGKFQKSIQACNQLLKLDSNCWLAKRYLSKNSRAIEVSNHKIAYSKLKMVQ